MPTLASCVEIKKKKKKEPLVASSSSSSREENKTTINDDDDYNNINIPGIRFVDYKDESQLHHVMNLVGRDLSEPYSVFTYRYFLYRFPHLCILAVPDTDDPNEEPIGCVVGKIDEEDILEEAFLEEDVEEEHHQQQHEASGISNDSNSNEEQLAQAQTTTSQQEGDEQEQKLPGGGGGGNESSVSELTTGYIGMLAVSRDYRRRGIGKALVHRVLARMKDLNCASATLETEVTNTTAQRLYQDCFGFIREELLVRYYLNWNDAYRLRLWFD